MHDDLLKQIVELYSETKAIQILAAELSSDEFLEYLQQIKEHRDAHDHIVRALANQYSLDCDQTDETRQRMNLDKALGHEYRAFFDSADWLSVTLRERIAKMVRPYGPSCLDDVLKDYSSKTRIRITAICREIAARRNSKDISQPGGILDDVHRYKGILDELSGIHDQIEAAIPALEERRRALRREAIGGRIVEMVVAVVIAAVIGTGTFFLGRFTAPHSEDGQAETPRPGPASLGRSALDE
jgi:hypothetical protein